MRWIRQVRAWAGRLSLTRQVALLSLLPMVALGFLLARVLQGQLVERTLSDATRSARIIANLGVKPRLSPSDLRNGLSAAKIAELDRELTSPAVGQDLARIKVWNTHDTVVYSEDHSLIGRRLAPSDDLEDALAGRPQEAELVDPSRDSETASEVGLGELIEVYVPLRFSDASAPAGVFEIYLSYRPVAAAVAADKREVAVLLAIALALLWAILYRIVAAASRRLRRQSRENHWLARHDPLTGLPNRMLMLEELAKALRHDRAVAVLLVDIERFTEINNTLGERSGDLVLREVARRLCSCASAESVARLGADEYALLCAEARDVADALALAAEVSSSLEPAVLVDGVGLDVECSVGVAVSGEHAWAAPVLLGRADLALAHARSHGSRVEVYSPRMERADADTLKLLGEVRQGIAAGQFELHYQPQVDLSSRRVVGVEALVRWRHPELGLLTPDRFVSLIEQTALIGPLTLHVIEQALAQARAWRRRGIALQMSVNLSARNLLDAALPAQVASLLASSEVPAAELVVEVTESSAISDRERGVSVLGELRALGVQVSIDDFGTGNASIEYVAGLPATELKIDRSFVTDMANARRDQAIVGSIVDLARNLGLKIVAEGIESEDALELLRRRGVQVGQGYLFSKPLPAEELTRLLSAEFGLGVQDREPPAQKSIASGAELAP